MQRQLEQAKADAGKHYAEKVDHDKYVKVAEAKKPQKFVIEGDEPTLQPKMWASAMRDASYYFDQPSIEQEAKMKKTLQAKYDDIFGEDWYPQMTNRTDLVSWVCLRQNKFMQANDAADKMWNCENPKALLEQFGPNYEVVKAKLGYVRGLERH